MPSSMSTADRLREMPCTLEQVELIRDAAILLDRQRHEISRLKVERASILNERDIARFELCHAEAELDCADKQSSSWQSVAADHGWEYLIHMDCFREE